MKKTTTPFLEQLDKLFKDYPNYCGASALFYEGHGSGGITKYGLRMEAPSIAREFTSNVYFGSGECTDTSHLHSLGSLIYVV